MYLEKRKLKGITKYYLVYSYRDKKVKKIRKYLGKDLKKEELNKQILKAKEQIGEKLEKILINVFQFSLSKTQIEKLNKYNKEISIKHLKQENWERFTEEFVYNTNAIEGSTVTRDEVPEILDKKKVTDNDEIETKSVAKAVEYIRDTKQDFSLELIKKLHKFCFKDSKSYAGEFRKLEVVIRDARGNVIYQGVPVKELDKYLKELVSWYKENGSKFKPLVLAGIIHNQFEHIHPFQDGNGRVGRLLLNYILIKSGYPPINILLEDRGEYYYILEEYSKNHRLLPTLQFLIKQYKKTLKKVGTKSNKS